MQKLEEMGTFFRVKRIQWVSCNKLGKYFPLVFRELQNKNEIFSEKWNNDWDIKIVPVFHFITYIIAQQQTIFSFEFYLSSTVIVIMADVNSEYI